MMGVSVERDRWLSLERWVAKFREGWVANLTRLDAKLKGM
jgi:hypothetical protein